MCDHIIPLSHASPLVSVRSKHHDVPTSHSLKMYTFTGKRNNLSREARQCRQTVNLRVVRSQLFSESPRSEELISVCRAGQ